MSGNDTSASTTLTSTSFAAVSTLAPANEEEDSTTLTLDCTESANMDLANGPNPWLPAYGFQLQHHSQFQSTHLEDLRANDTMLVQQVDFLETILEETSDDLQSDSDRSGTTYWLGSDSETESVIHIRAKQRAENERLDGSGSECNSVVPRKRRRRNADHHQQVTSTAAYDEYPASPRSSRSTASSRSSSLLQFESLERTCATLSPSSYSFDSLEYSNRSNVSHAENDSPDSLEQDCDRLLPNGFVSTLADHFPRIRPYRSFESLDTCQKDEDFGRSTISNGFAPLYPKRGADLSNIRKSNRRPRDFWHEEDEYEDDEEDDEDDFEQYERYGRNTDSRITSGFEDRLLLYGESGKYATSLDYRNTIDLREIGVETKRDTLLELKFTDKSQSAPSLLDSVGESARSSSSCATPPRLRTSRTTSYVSTSSLFENYTRVASVPVDLNLCGVAACDDEMNGHEMAETAPDDETAAALKSPRENEEKTQPATKMALTSSVRTQPAQSALMDGDVEEAAREEQRMKVTDCTSDDHEVQRAREGKQMKTTSTVKTQDRSNCVLDMVMVTENDLDEAIKQFKREVEEATASGVANAAILAMETIQRTASGRARGRKVKNNASYELAQQFEVDERNFQRKLKENDVDRDKMSPTGKRRMLNNASYELAQQSDYVKALQNSRAAFQRMDACDELEEAAASSGRSSALKVADVMRQMGSNTNISEDSSCVRPQVENDSFFSQIKKNSDPFSACGDASVLDPRLLEDEVDYPCLETKPISCLEDKVVQREKIQSRELESVLESSATKPSHIEEKSFRNHEDESEEARKSFIGELHLQRTAQFPRENESKARENSKGMPLTEEDLEERAHSPSDRAAGERLWRVVIEKQAKQKEDEKKRYSLEVENKKEEEVEKKEVGRSSVGTGECAPPGVPGSLGERGSGKPAVVVAAAAVDTNHRGRDHDIRPVEERRASSIGSSNKEDVSVAIARRPASSSATRKEPAKARVASSPSLSSSSSSSATAMKNEERKKGGLGGFLQRFSRLRFSGRTKVPRSEAQKKTVETKALEPQQQQLAAAKKKEPDYIIIPLHPPEEERRRQQEVVTLEEAARRNNVDVQRSASSVR
ncbi:hypothetical protein X777_14820 [Ooceraea biroi]|uniref:Uncharacterized protein n=1 Tax=Ooceraea biroi TaxID=2015173 RepID=A0A026WSM8_OOCBI|nr:hypothetical protein X777_14820 [Ooceraea biroi]